jgi:uncharacterized protein involved in exopolysaccharide biosynthesis
MDEENKGIGEYLAILKRRRWQFVVPVVLILLAATATALLLPPRYRSYGTILIEQQEIPQELVRTTVTSYAAERVQVISYRVLTTAKLGEIIEKFNLYPEKRKGMSLSVVAQEMRDDIDIDMISADVVDPRSGQSGRATIAFKLSYDNENPGLAQKVASELVTLFLNENLRTRRRAAEETSNFLSTEADRLSTELSDLEAKLATFKERHAENLPERLGVNMQRMQATEDQLRTTEQATRTLEERRIFLQAGLSQIDPYTASNSGAQRQSSAAERLRQLEVAYLGIAARYASDHPDRVNMDREIAALRRTVGVTETADLKRKLAEQKTELVTLRDRYSADHPDVKQLQRAIAATEKQVASVGKGGGTDGAATTADNPAYIQLQTQLQAADAELRALQQDRAQLRAKRAELEQLLADAPTIEREYLMLTRDYDNAREKYRELKAKQMEAELAQSLEADSKGERFSLVEPPQSPEKPHRPNRLAIFFLGFVFAFGGGIGHVALREGADTTVRGARGVMNVIGAPPLAVIPYIVTREESAKRRRRRILWLLAILIALGAGIALAHFVFGPLDVLWYRTLARLEMVFQGTAK